MPSRGLGGAGKMEDADRLLRTYDECLLRAFRRYKSNVFELTVYGLKEFIRGGDLTFRKLMEILESNNFFFRFEGEEKSVEMLRVEYVDLADNTSGEYEYQLVNLLSTLEFSSRTNLSLPTIFLMRIVSNLISKYKTLYKAIVLDLDDTLWCGTLSEDGLDCIVDNMHGEAGVPYVSFMSYVRQMAKELGIFVAICSRNDSGKVAEAIERIDEQIFPIKRQIDCIVANNNDKSENIKAIAKQLHIQTDAVVFIDDNGIERDKVRESLPEVLVLDWERHSDLTTQIIACCLFDRFELSLNAQGRREQLRIITEEVKKNSLPRLLIKASEDIGHKEAKKLYTKSNQFKFVAENVNYEGANSLFFEIFRQNGSCLGICSALTFVETETELHVLNWAISCRYFEIGLEEFLLQYLNYRADGKTVVFDFIPSGQNQKAIDFVGKYHGNLLVESAPNENKILLEKENIDTIKSKTNLELM